MLIVPLPLDAMTDETVAIEEALADATPPAAAEVDETDAVDDIVVADNKWGGDPVT